MTVSVNDAKQLLINAFGPGAENLYDFDGDIGLFLGAIGANIKQDGFDFVDILRQELNPATMVQKIPAWEQTCGLSTTPTALFGTTAQRRNQVIAKLRENSTFSLPDLRAALQPFFLYQDPTQIQILEPNRALLTTAHTYPYTGAPFTITAATNNTIQIFVPDDPVVSQAGARLFVTITATEVANIAITLSSVGPVRQKLYAKGSLGAGPVTNTTFSLGFPSVATGGIHGLWNILFVNGGLTGTYTVSACSLFVEAVGRNYDNLGNDIGQGLGAAMFEFAVVADMNLLGAGYDLVGARRTLKRMTPAHCGSAIIVKPMGATDVCAIPDLITTLPDISIPCFSVLNFDLGSIWAVAPGNFFMAGPPFPMHATQFVRFVGGVWSIVEIPTLVDGLWGSSPTNIWGVRNDGSIVLYDGRTWNPVASPATGGLLGVWGFAANDIWSVGTSGGIIHWDGASWSTVTSPTMQDLSATFGFASNDVWAVGKSGTIIHWNGTTWSTVTSPTANFLLAVWGFASNDVWSVGASGTIIHWDGASWSTVTSPTPYDLYGIWGLAANNVWAVGDKGVIIHWNGTSWSSVVSPVPATESLFAIAGTGPTDIWTVGTSGIAAHWDGASWTLVPVEV